jgi:hypothetical protein
MVCNAMVHMALNSYLQVQSLQIFIKWIRLSRYDHHSLILTTSMLLYVIYVLCIIFVLVDTSIHMYDPQLYQ